MRFGYFDDACREYVITRPDTPLPWINYLGCEEYFGLISNTAGGYSFFRDARLRRLTRYRYNNAPLDMGGRYIYLRDNGQRRISGRPPGCLPACRWKTTPAGTAWATPPSSPTREGIRANMRYFVPTGENLEVWQLTLTNLRNEPAQISAFSAVEFCLWDALDDATNFQRNFSHRAGGSGGRGDLSQDRIPRAPQPLCLLCLLRAAGRVRHPARGLPRPVPRLGLPGSGGTRRVGQFDRPRLAAGRFAPREG